MADKRNGRHPRAALNQEFPRLLVLLRKERGYSQKKVAEDLGVSQALLSHYEKGIRECGLEFVVRVAEYYGVSCDYLLGRTPHRTGAVLILPPDGQEEEAPAAAGEKLEYDRRVLRDSVNIVFALLEKIKNESLDEQVNAYLTGAVYKIFRMLYAAGPQNPQGIFSLDPRLFGAVVDAGMAMSEAKGRYILSGESIGDCRGARQEDLPPLNPDILTGQYPEWAPALFDLIKRVEQAGRRC